MINKQIEQSVLACMILDDNCSLDYNLLSVDDFTENINKHIYLSIAKLVRASKKVDYVTLYGDLKGQIDASYLAKLSQSIPTTTNFKQYVDQLKDLTIKRRLNLLAGDIRNSKLSGSELAELAEREIYSLREETSVNEFTKLSEVILDVYENIENIASGKVERGLPTGFEKVDSILGGMRKGEYIVLGARPSIGKTALAINIAENLLIRNKTIAFFSFEMAQEQVIERLIKSMAVVETGYKREMEAEEWKRLQDASGYIMNKNLYIDDNPNKSVADMQSMCRKLKRQKGLDLIIIDYLQKVKSNVRAGKREQLEQVSNDIKNMAKILKVPVLVVSSLSRESEKRSSQIPILSDLRETGQIEFDADVIMFLHREYYYDRTKSHLKDDADIVIAKNRNGKVGRTKLEWHEEYTKFKNVGDFREIESKDNPFMGGQDGQAKIT